MMLTKAIALSACLAAPTLADITSFDLSDYELTATFELPPVAASEASGVTYNWDDGHLYIVGDEGEAVVELDRNGTTVSTMTLEGFDDTEGLTYVGKGQFVVVEERIQDLYLFTYTAGGIVDRSTLKTVSLGDTVGNVGIEGVSFEPSTGLFYAVKEKNPQRAISATVDFDAGTAEVIDLFAPDLGTSDISDIQVLSTVPSLEGTEDQNNLLIYSQEGAILLEVSREGEILSSFDFSNLAGDAEGVTIDDQGIVYVCSESPLLFVLSPKGCPADLDGNKILDLFDFLQFTNLFNVQDPAADFDGNGEFDLFDFLAFTNAFNLGC